MTSRRGTVLLSVRCCSTMALVSGTPRSVGGLIVLLTKRLFNAGGMSLGTIRPPAVTRMPGGLPCSLRSFSALPRLIEGEGEGFLTGATGASAGVVEERRLLFEDAAAKVAEAEGRKTCSVITNALVLVHRESGSRKLPV
jgi:hypothetical protein